MMEDSLGTTSESIPILLADLSSNYGVRINPTRLRRYADKLSGLDFEVVKEALGTIDEVYDRFPSLRQVLDHYSVCLSKDKSRASYDGYTRLHAGAVRCVARDLPWSIASTNEKPLFVKGHESHESLFRHTASGYVKVGEYRCDDLGYYSFIPTGYEASECPWWNAGPSTAPGVPMRDFVRSIARDLGRIG